VLGKGVMDEFRCLRGSYRTHRLQETFQKKLQTEGKKRGGKDGVGNSEVPKGSLFGKAAEGIGPRYWHALERLPWNRRENIEEMGEWYSIGERRSPGQRTPALGVQRECCGERDPFRRLRRIRF